MRPVPEKKFIEIRMEDEDDIFASQGKNRSVEIE